MNKSDSIVNLAKALSIAQSQFTSVPRNCENPYFKSKYADLGAIMDMAREPLSKNGLSVSQYPSTTESGWARVETVLMHESGEWTSSTIDLKPAKSDPQGIGSAITYGRRYGVSAILGLATEDDDDGNKASSPKSNGAPAQQPARQQPPGQQQRQQAPAPAANGDEKERLAKLLQWCKDKWKELVSPPIMENAEIGAFFLEFGNQLCGAKVKKYTEWTPKQVETVARCLNKTPNAATNFIAAKMKLVEGAQAGTAATNKNQQSMRV